MLSRLGAIRTRRSRGRARRLLRDRARERAAQAHKRELEFCYDRELDRRRGAFDAVVDIAFHIDSAGGPARIELASTSGIGPFDSCVQSRVEKWISPQTDLPIRANYPFRLSVM